MTQYEDRVERQRIKIEAEEWAKQVKSIHGHSIQSMWYDDRPQDTEDGKTVVDRQFNNGVIERTLDNGEIFLFTKEELKGEALIDAFTKNN
tara:strand:+ start:179 stop:451 length:273 start_codon:yes stop_codon:yes gene_type:complete